MTRGRPPHASPSPPPTEANPNAFSCEDFAMARRAYAPQMLATVGVDNTVIEAGYAAVRREGVSWAALDGLLALRRRPPPSDPC